MPASAGATDRFPNFAKGSAAGIQGDVVLPPDTFMRKPRVSLPVGVIIYGSFLTISNTTNTKITDLTTESMM